MSQAPMWARTEGTTVQVTRDGFTRHGSERGECTSREDTGSLGQISKEVLVTSESSFIHQVNLCTKNNN